MIMQLAGRCATVVVAAAVWALPASAQAGKDIDELTQAQQAEMYCVYNTLAENGGYELVAESYLYTDLSKDDQAKSETQLKSAVTACAGKYSWSQNAQDVAADIGTYGSAVDYLTEDLWFDGVEDEEVDKVFAILDTLSEGDIDAFSDGTWMKNDALKTRVTGQLKAAGLPDEEYTLETGQYVLEASVLAADAIFEWIDTVVK